MLISQTTDSLIIEYDIFTILDEFKKAGFDAYDFSFCHEKIDGCLVCNDDYIEKAKEIREYADKIGLICNQAHAPFLYYWEGDAEKTKELKRNVTRSIEAAGVLGAKVIVLHPVNNLRYKDNIRLLSEFLPYAKKANIKIGVENMWNWTEGSPKCTEAACSFLDDFLKTMEGLDHDYYVANVDIGHAEMFEKGYAYKLIKGLGKYVQSLHIHDNDCVHDLHRIPLSESIDFDHVCKALKEINYQGDVTLEIINFQGDKDFLYKLPEQAKVAKKLRKMINK